MRSSWLRALALTLALTTGFTGCVATGSQETRIAQCADRDDGLFTQTAAPRTLAEEPSDSPHELQQIHHHGGGRAAAWFAVGLVIGVIVVADVLILPFTAPRHECFYCTRTVVYHCCN